MLWNGTFPFDGKSMETETTTWLEISKEGKAIVKQMQTLEERNKSHRAGLWDLQSGNQVGMLTIWVRSFEIWDSDIWDNDIFGSILFISFIALKIRVESSFLNVFLKFFYSSFYSLCVFFYSRTVDCGQYLISFLTKYFSSIHLRTDLIVV